MKKLLLFGTLILNFTSFGQQNLKFVNTTIDGEELVKVMVLDGEEWIDIDETVGFCDYFEYADLPKSKIYIDEPLVGSKMEVIHMTYLDDECFYIYKLHGDGEIAVDKHCGDAQFDERYSPENLYYSGYDEIYAEHQDEENASGESSDWNGTYLNEFGFTLIITGSQSDGEVSFEFPDGDELCQGFVAGTAYLTASSVAFWNGEYCSMTFTNQGYDQIEIIDNDCEYGEACSSYGGVYSKNE